MKQRIEIRNFGPIQKVELDISDYTLFIGPNASGKSTIAKLVYFFQTPINLIDLDQIKNSVRQVSLDMDNPQRDWEKSCDACKEAVDSHFQSHPGLKESWEKAVKSHFQELWDIQALQNDFQVNYYHKELDEDRWRLGIVIKNVDNELNVTFTDDYIQWIRTSLSHAVNFELYGGSPQRDTGLLEERLPLFSFSTMGSPRLKHTQFIPAGRQFLSLPTDNFPLFSKGRIEPLVEEFMLLVKRKKSSFHKSIQEEFNEFETKSEKHELEHGPENINWGYLETMKLVLDLSARILKGRYINTREGERIYFNEKQFVKLFEASSGQQESLWIINLIYLLLSEYCWSYSSSNFTIIEEPEAHLYPETQRDVTYLISLLANQTGNQVMITTHSPYILSALNNLLYAHKVGKSKPDEVAKIIDPLLWNNLNLDRVTAYKVENGGIRDIVDRRSPENPEGLDMIVLEEIDAVPKDTIVEDYERLFELDDCINAD